MNTTDDPVTTERHGGTLRDHVDARKCWRAMQRAAVLAVLNDTDPRVAMGEAVRTFVETRMVRAITDAFEQAIREAQHGHS